jgi:nucleotide-binding universal stress UspA family protein
MVAKTFTSLGSKYRDAAWKFFDWGRSSLHVTDPAGYSGDLAAKFTWDQTQAIEASLASARDRARNALDAEESGDHVEAIRLWRIIFGDLFPAYG